MRLVALTEEPDHVCGRYRLAAFRPFLTVAGHTLDLRPLPGSLFARAALFRELRTADAVILQRKLLPGVQLSLLRRYARRLIFDFDDAVWLRDSYSAKGVHSRRRVRRFARTVRSADVVIAGNTFLADAAARHNPPGRIEVIPTCVNPATYPLAEHTRSDGLQLVWVGSASTLQGVNRIRPLLEAVGQAVPGTRLKLICDRFIGFEYLPVDPVPWCEATEAREIATADIGITWIPDDDWSRGKCGLKVLQYQAAGLPVIANPVGVHPQLVKSPDTGVLAATPDEWITALKTLIDPGIRMTLGRAGRKRLEDGYSVATGGQMWADLLQRLNGSMKRVS